MVHVWCISYGNAPYLIISKAKPQNHCSNHNRTTETPYINVYLLKSMYVFRLLTVMLLHTQHFWEPNSRQIRRFKRKNEFFFLFRLQMHWENSIHIYIIYNCVTKKKREWKQKTEKKNDEGKTSEEIERANVWLNWEIALWTMHARAQKGTWNAESARKIHTKKPHTHFEQRLMWGLFYFLQTVRWNYSIWIWNLLYSCSVAWRRKKKLKTKIESNGQRDREEGDFEKWNATSLR